MAAQIPGQYRAAAGQNGDENPGWMCWGVWSSEFLTLCEDSYIKLSVHESQIRQLRE